MYEISFKHIQIVLPVKLVCRSQRSIPETILFSSAAFNLGEVRVECITQWHWDRLPSSCTSDSPCQSSFQQCTRVEYNWPIRDASDKDLGLTALFLHFYPCLLMSCPNEIHFALFTPWHYDPLGTFASIWTDVISSLFPFCSDPVTFSSGKSFTTSSSYLIFFQKVSQPSLFDPF